MLFIINLLSNKAVHFHIIHMQGQTLELLQNTSFDIICNETAVACFKYYQRICKERVRKRSEIVNVSIPS